MSSCDIYNLTNKRFLIFLKQHILKVIKSVSFCINRYVKHSFFAACATEQLCTKMSKIPVCVLKFEFVFRFSRIVDQKSNHKSFETVQKNRDVTINTCFRFKVSSCFDGKHCTQLSHVFNAEIFIVNEGNWMLIGKIGFYNTSQHSHIHTLTARWLV